MIKLLSNWSDVIVAIGAIIGALSLIINTMNNMRIKSKKKINEYIKEALDPSLKEINEKLDTSISKEDRNHMQQLRYNCLCFANDLRNHELKTRQQYEEIFRMESDYESLIKEYGLENGYMEEEMLYVHEKYRSLK